MDKYSIDDDEDDDDFDISLPGNHMHVEHIWLIGCMWSSVT